MAMTRSFFVAGGGSGNMASERAIPHRCLEGSAGSQPLGCGVWYALPYHRDPLLSAQRNEMRQPPPKKMSPYLQSRSPM